MVAREGTRPLPGAHYPEVRVFLLAHTSRTAHQRARALLEARWLVC